MDGLIMGYMMEAWQSLCAGQAGVAGYSGTGLTGQIEQSGDPASLRWVDVECYGDPTWQDLSFGLPNTNYFGQAAFLYGSYAGALQYLNWERNRLFPDGPNATGIFLNLKVGTSADLFCYGGAHTVDGYTAPDGQVNLVNGDYAGLI
jgi:hypothetical protein